MGSRCLLCKSQLIDKKQYLGAVLCDCPKCTQYYIRYDNVLWLKRTLGAVTHNDSDYFSSSDRDKEYSRVCTAVSCYIERDNSKWTINNTLPTVDMLFLKRLFSSNIIPWSPEEKVRELLKYVNKNTTCFGEMIPVNSRIIFTDEVEELNNIVNALSEEDFIKKSPSLSSTAIALTIKGINYLQEKKSQQKNNECFVAICFDDFMENVWDNAIRPACLEAGYKAIRVDQVQPNDDITDRVIAGIKSADFVIADLSGYRADVCYAVGFAKGLNKETILTCEKKWFDLNRPNTVIWDAEDLEDFKETLKNQILVTIGKGGYVE